MLEYVVSKYDKYELVGFEKHIQELRKNADRVMKQALYFTCLTHFWWLTPFLELRSLV